MPNVMLIRFLAPFLGEFIEEIIKKKRKLKREKSQKHKNKFFLKCLWRHGILRVFVLFCVLVFVRAILSRCP